MIGWFTGDNLRLKRGILTAVAGGNWGILYDLRSPDLNVDTDLEGPRPWFLSNTWWKMGYAQRRPVTNVTNSCNPMPWKQCHKQFTMSADSVRIRVAKKLMLAEPGWTIPWLVHWWSLGLVRSEIPMVDWWSSGASLDRTSKPGTQTGWIAAGYPVWPHFW